MIGKKIICVALAASLMTATSAMAENIVINVSYAGSTDSTYGIFTSLFKKYAEASVDGVTIKPRCCASLITEDEAFKALQLGTVDMAIITGNNVSPHYPLWDAFVLPYIFMIAITAIGCWTAPSAANFEMRLKRKPVCMCCRGATLFTVIFTTPSVPSTPWRTWPVLKFACRKTKL